MWISLVALAIRNKPPPIKMMSRQEISIAKNENRGEVRPTSQVSANSIAIRKMKASERPMRRAHSAASGVQRDTRIEMKTMLSMPRTISSAVSVASAAQVFGSERSLSIFRDQPAGISAISRSAISRSIILNDREPWS